MQKKLILAIFILGLALCVILTLIALTPPVDNAAGIAHPQYESMRAGGDGAMRIEPIKTLAFVFQILVLAQFACFITLGVSDRKRSPVFYSLITGAFLLTVFVWWRLFAGHQQYLQTGETQYFLGFPTATAWVVYGVYLGGVCFIAIYVIGFKKFIWSDEDEAAYRRLLADYPNGQ